MLLAVMLLGASGGGDTDPYRYMESGGAEFSAWEATESAATVAMLAKARAQAGIDEKTPAAATWRITDLTAVDKQVFFMRHTATSDELVERAIAGGPEHTIVTDRTFTPDGSGYLGAFAVSSDAKIVAIHVSRGHALATDIYLIRASDGKQVEAPLHGTIFDYVTFTPDNRSIMYASTPTPIVKKGMPGAWYDYIHRLGSAQSADPIAFGAGVSPLAVFTSKSFAFVDPSGPQAVAEVRDIAAGGSRFYAAPLAAIGRPGTPWRPLGDASAGYTDEVIHGTSVDLATSANAPNYAVVRASLDGPFAPRIVLPASDHIVVSGTLDFIPKAGIFCLNAAADADYVQLLDHGFARMVRIPYAGDSTPIPVALPFSGSIVEAAADQNQPGVLVHLTSWTTLGDVYAFDPQTPAMTALGLLKEPAAPARVAEEITATADDGTPIGVSVVHRPGIALDGSHPLILQVAGAYGFSMTPDYRLVPEAWLEHGGVYAVAHVRGGGEQGEAWHRAGMGALKKNTWNDLIASAKRLIALGYTSPKRLNLYGTTQSYLGGIASSIAIGRAIEEQPSLFAAAVIDAPVFDMLRSEQTSMGAESVSEFGSASSEAGAQALLAMSPYEHVRPGVPYPPILVRSFAKRGSGDDWQAAKMVARWQAATGRADSAYLDLVGAAPGDTRQGRELRDDALSFFLLEDKAP